MKRKKHIGYAKKKEIVKFIVTKESTIVEKESESGECR